MGTDRSPELEATPDGAAFCARHPTVETYLRCSRCETPICPRCLVQTPVGARCRDCAKISRLPTIDVTPVYFARGMTAALVSGLIVGAAWAFVTPTLYSFIFALLIGAGIGWAVSESVSLATNRKRGLGLQICAGMGVVIAFLFQEFLSDRSFIPDTHIMAAVVGVLVAISRLKFA